MGTMLLGRKVGMTRFFTEEAKSVPVTVIQAGPCVVTQIRTAEKDGYNAVQIGFMDMPARNSTMPLIGHDAKAGTTPKRYHREFRVSEEELANYELGQTFGPEVFENCAFVDAIGISKGKGFQGQMKRHNFAGLEASHGVERKHRTGGSIGGGGTNRGTGPKLMKGKRMAGHMGAERVTVRSLDIVKIDPDNGLILVKGPVPGHNNAMIELRTPSRLFTPKARKQKEAAG
ncbi:MAG: 50S ribosomal protein L3 [Phycisphaeraceae bacterium]|nr:50S ribosomal protein L3 [Phycisphaeraceae bacterium]MCB9847277.1 50S ribosomal protein L3 [Phycisphaeraceae bacterium]